MAGFFDKDTVKGIGQNRQKEQEIAKQGKGSRGSYGKDTAQNTQQGHQNPCNLEGGRLLLEDQAGYQQIDYRDRSQKGPAFRGCGIANPHGLKNIVENRAKKNQKAQIPKIFPLKPKGGQPHLFGKKNHDKKGDKKAPAQQSHRRNLVADLLGKEVTQTKQDLGPKGTQNTPKQILIISLHSPIIAQLIQQSNISTFTAL